MAYQSLRYCPPHVNKFAGAEFGQRRLPVGAAGMATRQLVGHRQALYQNPGYPTMSGVFKTFFGRWKSQLKALSLTCATGHYGLNRSAPKPAESRYPRSTARQHHLRPCTSHANTTVHSPRRRTAVRIIFISGKTPLESAAVPVVVTLRFGTIVHGLFLR